MKGINIYWFVLSNESTQMSKYIIGNIESSDKLRNLKPII